MKTGTRAFYRCFSEGAPSEVGSPFYHDTRTVYGSQVFVWSLPSKNINQSQSSVHLGDGTYTFLILKSCQQLVIYDGWSYHLWKFLTWKKEGKKGTILQLKRLENVMLQNLAIMLSAFHNNQVVLLQELTMSWQFSRIPLGLFMGDIYLHLIISQPSLSFWNEACHIYQVHTTCDNYCSEYNYS